MRKFKARILLEVHFNIKQIEMAFNASTCMPLENLKRVVFWYSLTVKDEYEININGFQCLHKHARKICVEFVAFLHLKVQN